MSKSIEELPQAGADRSPGSDISPMTQVPPKTDQASTSTLNIASKANLDYFAPTVKNSRDQSGTSGASGVSMAGDSIELRRSGTRTEASEITGSTSSSSASVAVSSPLLTSAHAPNQLSPGPSPGASPGLSPVLPPRPLPRTTHSSGHIRFANSADRRPSSLSDFSSDTIYGNTLRKSSAVSVSFRAPRHNLPQGQPKQERRRSPAPTRFRKHVGFDNIPLGEATKYNTLGYTLSISHYGYRPQKNSRTVMVGVDQNVYSDFALQWLVEEYADDGDEIICVHVVDKDARSEEKNYKARAETMVERIKSKIPENRAIGIKLEYAVGKLHDTFQKLILVYQPSMLVVGTRGRSLGGIQGLVNKNSFSKYCLQYSPVPTVVVRDDAKRKKKKEKRSNDPTRQTYASMLCRTNGVHEANLETSSIYDMEARISPDEEAHRVAAAIGLPAAFDPTLKPIDIDQILGRRSRTSSPAPGAASLSPAIARSRSPLQSQVLGSTATSINAPSPLSEGVSFTAPKSGSLRSGGDPTDLAADEVPDKASVESEDEDSGDDDDDDDDDNDSGGFEVMSGEQALQHDQARGSRNNNNADNAMTETLNRTRLHNMEMAEGDALKKNKQAIEDDEEEERASKESAGAAANEAEQASPPV